jgi:hypothetical protein
MRLRIASNITVGAILFSVLLVASLTVVRGQERNLTTADHTMNLKTLVVATQAKSDSEIAIPPATSTEKRKNGRKRSRG